MTRENDAFVRDIAAARALELSRPALINVIDPAAEYGDKSSEDLRDWLTLGGSPSGQTLFVVLDLVFVREEELVPDIIAQVAWRLQKCGPEEVAEKFRKLWSDLSPWSPLSRYELADWTRNNIHGGGKTYTVEIAVRELEQLPVSWEPAVVSAVRVAAECFAAKHVFLLTEKRLIADADTHIWKLSNRSEFLAEIKKALPALEGAPESGGKRSYWQRLRALLSLRGTQQSLDPLKERYVRLIEVATFPSVRLRKQAMQSLQSYCQALDTKNSEGDPGDLGERAARESFLQVVFLKLLQVSFPALMHAALTQVDGFHRLYRLQLHLAGDGPSPKERVDPTWMAFHDDPRLKAFLAATMSRPHLDHYPLVPPFSSARAIREHCMVFQLFDDPLERPWQQTLRALQKVWEELDEKRAELSKLGGELFDTRRRLERALRLFESTDPNTQSSLNDAKQAAAHLGKLKTELEKKEKELEREVPDRLKDILKSAIEELRTCDPVDQTADAVLEAGDALELNLRILALAELLPAQQADSLEEIRRCVRRLHSLSGQTHGYLLPDLWQGVAIGSVLLNDRANAQIAIQRGRSTVSEEDELGNISLDLAEAFLIERVDSKYADAERKYLDIRGRSERLQAGEFMLRAAYGALRCRIMQIKRDGWSALHLLQAFLTIRAARTPWLPGLASSALLVFLSYRRGTQTFVRGVQGALEKHKLAAWADYKDISESSDDFRSAMQLGLDRSAAVVLVFSPSYLRSRWCTYELSTALARRKINAVRIYWLCLDRERDEVKSLDPRERVRKLAEYASDFSTDEAFFKSQLEEILIEDPLHPEVVTGCLDDEDVNSDKVSRISGEVSKKVKDLLNPGTLPSSPGKPGGR